eukprot:gene13663-15056_t
MILHFIQDLFHVLVVLCLLHSLAAAPCTQYDYSTASPSVTVSNYNQLNCAVFYEVFFNQIISFSSEIVLPSQSNITVQGSTSNIALRTSGSARLFNVTRALVLSCGGSVFVSDSSLTALSQLSHSAPRPSPVIKELQVERSFQWLQISISLGAGLPLMQRQSAMAQYTAAGSGGGIELVNSVSATIVQTNFTSDSAASLGGSIFSSAARISLTSVSINCRVNLCAFCKCFQ